jgi:hypothetical protein
VNSKISGDRFSQTTWPRHLARLAMIAAVLCFLSQVAYAVGIGLLLSGVALAATSLFGAIRTSNYDTGVIAVIGLVINGGVLLFLVWYVCFVRPTLPLEN